jgi:hypothetical protein
MSRMLSPKTGKPYGIARVCRIWRMARANIYRHRLPGPPVQVRPGPSGPMPDAALLEQIRAVLSTSPFHGEGHRKVWAKLVKVPPAQRVEYQRRVGCGSVASGRRCVGCCG